MTADVWRSLADVPADDRRSVVTLGNFDGVHRGHQAVLAQVVRRARERSERAVALTFDPHPLVVHRPETPPVLITGLDDRLERMAATGLDAVLVASYTPEFAEQTGEEFVRTWLLDGLRASTIVVGHDTKFGRGNACHVDALRELGKRLGFDVVVLDWLGGDEGEGRRWSSTWVRELVEAGDVAAAADVLGWTHRVRGEVVHGDALGRTIGFPTANLDVTEGMIPGNGVYAGWFTLVRGGSSVDGGAYEGVRWPAAVSLGLNYTVGGTDRRVEAHLIGAPDVDIYGAFGALDFVERHRGMRDFGSIDALRAALAEDVEWCRETLGLE